MNNVTPPPESYVLDFGRRLKTRREGLSMSQEVLAGMAGISRSYVSMLETGSRGLPDHHALAAIAAALRCSVAHLTGHPPVPVTPEDHLISASVHDLVKALVETSLSEPPVIGEAHLGQLLSRYDTAAARHSSGDLTAACGLLPRVVTGAHLLFRQAGCAQDRRAACNLMIEACWLSRAVMRYLGHADAVYVCAARAAEAAEHASPEHAALAHLVKSHVASSSGSLRRAATLALSGLDVHSRLSRTSDAGTCVTGHMHLMASYSLAAADPAASVGHLAEATRLATTIDDHRNLLGLHFGGANVAVWRIGIAVDPQEALSLITSCGPQASQVDSGERRAQLHGFAASAYARAQPAGWALHAMRHLYQGLECSAVLTRRSPQAATVVAQIADVDMSPRHALMRDGLAEQITWTPPA